MHLPIFITLNMQQVVVPRFALNELSYAAFCTDFLDTNMPVILTNVNASWHASKHWCRENGDIDWKYLECKYGHFDAPVTDIPSVTRTYFFLVL